MAYKDKDKQKEYAYRYWRENKDRESERIKKWRLENKEEYKEKQKAYRLKNAEKLNEQKREYYIRTKNIKAIYAKKYAEKNPHIINKTSAKRRAARLNRTPSWLTKDDLWIINEIYELAILRTKVLGVMWHVDHIIPLQGKLVSGLHVPSNLQVILGAANHTKNNKYEIEHAK
jgi:5-methylcytosine-specific restriction endonuclease McrA